MRRPRLQNVSMPNVLIRDLPADAHAVLARRARESGMSLQKYLVRELTRTAATPTVEEFVTGLDTTMMGAAGDDITEIIRADRDGR